jgi:hypothetical protein
LAHPSTRTTPQSEKYVDGSAFTSVDDMRRGEYDYRHGPAFDFDLVEDEKVGIYEAIVGD